jgi:hypothetical protein
MAGSLLNSPVREKSWAGYFYLLTLDQAQQQVCLPAALPSPSGHDNVSNENQTVL